MTTADIIKGLQLLAPIAGSEYYTQGEHDVLLTSVQVDDTPPEIAAQLKADGWHEEYGCWAAFT